MLAKSVRKMECSLDKSKGGDWSIEDAVNELVHLLKLRHVNVVNGGRHHVGILKNRGRS